MTSFPMVQNIQARLQSTKYHTPDYWVHERLIQAVTFDRKILRTKQISILPNHKDLFQKIGSFLTQRLAGVFEQVWLTQLSDQKSSRVYQTDGLPNFPTIFLHQTYSFPQWGLLEISLGAVIAMASTNLLQQIIIIITRRTFFIRFTK